MGMKRGMILAGSIGFAVALAGCNTDGGMSKLTVAVSDTIGKTNNVLARLSGNEIPAACAIIDVAKGYFRALEPRISAKNIAIERQAEASVAVICDNPPANVSQAMATLLKLWFTIQNATKTSA